MEYAGNGAHLNDFAPDVSLILQQRRVQQLANVLRAQVGQVTAPAYGDRARLTFTSISSEAVDRELIDIDGFPCSSGQGGIKWCPLAAQLNN